MDKEIVKKFLGTEIDSTFEKVVITNIKPIYEGILKKARVIKQDEGFYLNSFIEVRGKSLRVIKITPGNVIIDVLKLLKDNTKEIVLVGLVASLRDKFRIGSVVCPAKTVHFNDIERSIPFSNNNNGLGKICQTDGLIHEHKFYENLARKGIDFVDMESYYLAQFAFENKKRSKLIGIISDNPISSRFHEVEDQSRNINYDLIIDQL